MLGSLWHHPKAAGGVSAPGAGLRVLHLLPGLPARDANVLPAAWHRCDSTGTSLPLQGPESPPGRVLPPPGPPSTARSRAQPAWEERCAPSQSGSQFTLPALGGVSPLGGTPGCGGGVSLSAGRAAAVPRGLGRPPAQRLAGKSRGCLHSQGGPGAGGHHLGTSGSPQPASLAGSTRTPPRPAPFLHPLCARTGGSARSPGCDRVPERACPSVCPFAVPWDLPTCWFPRGTPLPALEVALGVRCPLPPLCLRVS